VIADSEVITDVSPPQEVDALVFESSRGQATSPQPSPRTSACEPFREAIELGLSRGRNAMAIWQDLVSEYSFASSYQNVQRFVRKLRGTQAPEARVVIVTAPGQESQVDYGQPRAFFSSPRPWRAGQRCNKSALQARNRVGKHAAVDETCLPDPLLLRFSNLSHRRHKAELRISFLQLVQRIQEKRFLGPSVGIEEVTMAKPAVCRLAPNTQEWCNPNIRSSIPARFRCAGSRFRHGAHSRARRQSAPLLHEETGRDATAGLTRRKS
jgi:hypothetical protein